MIDWNKLGPANSPTPSTPNTTAPVAPVAPGSLAAPSAPGGSLFGNIPTVGGNAPIQTGKGYHEATQAQVDSLGPGERIGRGVDFLGNTLFGQGNGSPLGGVPLLGDILGGAGDVAHNVGDWTVIKPFEAAAAGAARVPLGWIPGGADDTFKQFGDWAKTNDPKAYEGWQAVNAASNGDVLGGGNMKADWNMEFAKYMDDQKHDSVLGTTPVLSVGKAAVGSVGGAVSAVIQSFLGVAGNTVQRALGGAGGFDPGDGAGTGTTRNRVQESAARLARGEDVSDVEKKAVEAFQSGAWSEDHAQDYIVSHGQGITRNPVGQILGSLVTDPLTYATLGAGSIAKAGQVGTRIVEAGAEASSIYEQAAVRIANLQKLSIVVDGVKRSPTLGSAFRVARGMVDPLAVYKPSTVASAVTDLRNGVALASFERGYGPQTVTDLRAIARETGMTSEVDSAIASYSIDQANLMIARKAQRDMLEQGLGEELVHSNVDDVIDPIAKSAGRDAVTQLTDHMLTTAKNTFTVEEEASLAGRLAVTFGGDAPSWASRMSGMSSDLKSALHAMTYKRAEVDFEQARAAIDHGGYTGDLPLRNMVLMTSDTLDNVSAEGIISNIRSVLKLSADAEPQKIAAATAEWNTQARRFPVMANIGYATGGKEQVETLVRELEKQLQSGGITRRALDAELSDPALRPVRDMLDRHTVSGTPQYASTGRVVTSEEMAALKVRGNDLLNVAPAKDSVDLQVAVDGVAGELHQRTALTEWGGATYSPRTGQFIEDVAAGTATSDGPWVSGIGQTTSISIKEAQDPAAFKAALDQFVADNADELQKPGMYVGTFRDEKLGQVQFDVALATLTEADTEAVQAAAGRTGGAYNTATGNGLFAPTLTTPADAALAGPQSLWKVGFRPDEEVAWGLKRDVNTGRYVVDRDPTISHVVDAVPGRQPFSDTTRNVLGQIIGKSGAERLNKPIDSIEAMVNTMRDGVTGQRLVKNIERRYEKVTFDAGIPKPISKEIWAKAREVAGLDYTTVRGIKPDNLWNAIHEIVPRDLVLKDGSTLNVHIVMDHLLQAAEGDLRVMGVTSVLSQRMRNALRHTGMDPANWAGQMTVTMYNKLRYSQPMFLIQRITDAPYYSILYGVKPVGKAALKGENAELAAITENLGRSGMARDFSMDMPEYATRTNFTAGIKSSMQEAGLLGNKLDRVLRAPDTIIANNMTNMLHSRLGDIVKGSLDNLASAAEKGDPALLEEMAQAGETLTRSFGDWRRVYSEAAGRVLDDNEVGLRYVQDQLNAWRRHVVNTDGTLDFSRLIAEGERSMPNEIADIGTIKPDILAQELGYADSAALRRDVVGHIEKIHGVFTVVKGEHDVAWLEEQLRATLGAHPDYTRRAMAYYGETWDDFWTRLSHGVDDGGLDISPRYAKEAQDLIAVWARDRGMDPWEYLSGVMASNIGVKDLETHMGQLVGFLKSGKAKAPLEEWSKVFRGTLDVSAQKELLKEFEAAVPVEDVIKVPTPAKFTQDAKGNAVLPKGYTTEPGYVYRVETLATARGGWPKRTGVSSEATSFYSRGADGEGVFRTAAGDDALDVGRHGAGGKDRLTKSAIPPEQIEMLGEDGKWVALTADPMDAIMAKDFPEMVRQRIISGAPHANPEVEGYIEQFSKWVSSSIQGELSTRTRADLRRLVEAVPTTHASPFNRSHALVTSLLKNKIEDAQSDVFRLAEMQTKRNVLERSLNHPLFGLYPASYMWGKVLPETVKFLAKNPYAATYTIANVQRSIAIQREYDSDMDDKVSAVDRSAGAFLLDYMTPGLAWSDHESRMSPMVRDLFAGKDVGQIWSDELATVSPQRWVKQFISSANEIPSAIESLTEPTSQAPAINALQGITNGGVPAPVGPTEPVSITGPTQASALAPILADDLERLSSILLQGQDPSE